MVDMCKTFKQIQVNVVRTIRCDYCGALLHVGKVACDLPESTKMTKKPMYDITFSYRPNNITNRKETARKSNCCSECLPKIVTGFQWVSDEEYPTPRIKITQQTGSIPADTELRLGLYMNTEITRKPDPILMYGIKMAEKWEDDGDENV